MEKLLLKLKQAGIGIQATGEQLKISVPEGYNHANLINEIRENKDALLEFIQSKNEGHAKPPPVLPVPQEKYELFYQQKKEYLRYLLTGSYAFNLNMLITFRKIDRSAFFKALQVLFDRHESLRTTFFHEDGKMYQQVHPNFPINGIVEELDISKDKFKEDSAAEIWNASISYPFNFNKELMIDLKLVKVLHDTHVLLAVMHHVISDDVSVKLLKDEMQNLYEAFAKKKPNPLPPPKWQYKDYAQWINELLRSEKAVKARAYYTQKIASSVEQEHERSLQEITREMSYRQELADELGRAPGYQNMPLKEELFGSIVRLYPPPGAVYVTYLPGAIVDKIVKLAVRHKTSLNMIMTAAFATMLAMEGDKNVRFFMPCSTRLHEEFDAIAGWLISEIIVCIDVDLGLDFLSLLKHVERIFFETMVHSFYPHEMLLNDLNLPLSVLAPYFINFIPAHDEVIHDTTPVHIEEGSGHFNFRCVVFEFSNALKFTTHYNSNLYSPAEAERMINTFMRVINRFVLEEGNFQLTALQPQAIGA